MRNNLSRDSGLEREALQTLSDLSAYALNADNLDRKLNGAIEALTALKLKTGKIITIEGKLLVFPDPKNWLYLYPATPSYDKVPLYFAYPADLPVLSGTRWKHSGFQQLHPSPKV